MDSRGIEGRERAQVVSQLPLETGVATAMVNVYVADVDVHYRRVKAEGSHIVMELEDMFWGDRRYEALDLEGHRWHLAQRLSDIQQ